MTMKEKLHQKLSQHFTPQKLDIIDESHLHQGHSGWREGGESHFRITIIAKAFEGQTRLQMHRAVNEVLKEELENDIHALALKTSTPK